MVYITVKQPPQYHQMTLEEFLLMADDDIPSLSSLTINGGTTNTRTYTVDSVSESVRKRFDVRLALAQLVAFNDMTKSLRERPRQELYHTFYIPKQSGGLRRIDAPNDELMNALRQLKGIFENDFGVLYHTSAFAYVKHRCVKDAAKRHQSNESKWFAKYDLSNFFGSTTPEFVRRMFSMIFPFTEIIKTETGRRELATALDLCFLNGGLPQGTPISPLITNIMMIPIDHRLANDFRSLAGTGIKADNRDKHQRFVYTRYADDFQISSRYEFSFRAVENHIREVLQEFRAPFTVKREKTRYGSSSGANWFLGMMINGDNEITVGYKRKRQFKAMLTHYILDRKNGVKWEKNDIQVLDGYRNYYRMIEKEKIDEIVQHLGEKFNADVVRMIRQDLAA